MNKKSLWQRDSTHRLERKESPIKRIIEIYEQTGSPSSRFSEVLVENHSEHRNNDNGNEGVEQPVRTLRDYLQPAQQTTPSCMVMLVGARGDPTSPEIARTRL